MLCLGKCVHKHIFSPSSLSRYKFLVFLIIFYGIFVVSIWCWPLLKLSCLLFFLFLLFNAHVFFSTLVFEMFLDCCVFCVVDKYPSGGVFCIPFIFLSFFQFYFGLPMLVEMYQFLHFSHVCKQNIFLLFWISFFAAFFLVHSNCMWSTIHIYFESTIKWLFGCSLHMFHWATQ